MKRRWKEISKTNWKRAEKLRKNLTPAERVLWQGLRAKQLGVTFRRQSPIGPYIVDFCSTNINLVVEIDGHTHAGDTNEKYDQTRTDYLINHGWRVIRYTNSDIMTNLENVLEDIRQQIAEGPP